MSKLYIASFSVGAIAQYLAVSPAKASAHLRTLSDAGILKKVKRGRLVSYGLALGLPGWVRGVVREGV